jgi:hypothetical protein
MIDVRNPQSQLARTWTRRVGLMCLATKLMIRKHIFVEAEARHGKAVGWSVGEKEQ